MTSIILPIKPQYVNRILDGSKKFEFRLNLIKNLKYLGKCKQEIKKIYIYETAPTKKVVAEVVVDYVLEGTPEEIWSKCEKYSGINKKDYDNYFNNCKEAIAYKIGDVKRYEIPKLLSEYGVNYVPQSFVYIR